MRVFTYLPGSKSTITNFLNLFEFDCSLVQNNGFLFPAHQKIHILNLQQVFQ